MPEMHLRQPGFTYSACRPFTKNKESIRKFKQTAYSRYIYKTKRDKACFQHDMAYEYFEHLAKRTAADKVLRGLKAVVSLRLQINMLLKLYLKMKN